MESTPEAQIKLFKEKVKSFRLKFEESNSNEKQDAVALKKEYHELCSKYVELLKIVTEHPISPVDVSNLKDPNVQLLRSIEDELESSIPELFYAL
ncbi:unnamed protein product [Brachionus calyciflorus]|uniref:Uncharacterized protein n=1 Tax=Brachionus calyciflorus TaxID=104777 RepID=A0A814M8P1_9BILA|nr:unnamed protein product [Brachionus calyciflorus]